MTVQKTCGRNHGHGEWRWKGTRGKEAGREAKDRAEWKSGEGRWDERLTGRMGDGGGEGVDEVEEREGEVGEEEENGNEEAEKAEESAE